MSTKNKNLSHYTSVKIKDAKKVRIGIVVSEWNKEITDALCEGACHALIKHGLLSKHILTYYVPGSFELPLGAQFLIKSKKVDAVVCLGCIIQGETRHFDFIAQATADAISQAALQNNKPIAFGVLTTNTLQQAKDRAGGKYGNKGIEAAITVLKMLALQKQINQ